ncbi:hypothetical protein BH10CYA1_BH10CYA1_38170 [soil metagenome]
MIEAVAPNHMNKKGEVIDPKGRIISTVHKESAIRSRDGKDFEVLDTSSPLGNMRPGDVVKQR